MKTGLGQYYTRSPESHQASDDIRQELTKLRGDLACERDYVKALEAEKSEMGKLLRQSLERIMAHEAIRAELLNALQGLMQIVDGEDTENIEDEGMRYVNARKAISKSKELP